MSVVVTVLFAGVLALRLRCGAASATCEESNVRVLVVTVAADNHELFDNKKIVNIAYGDKITIFCTGSDSEKLQMSFSTSKLDDHNFFRRIQDTEIVNITTRKLIMQNPAIDVYDFSCIDVGTTCAMEFKVVLYPVVTVLSTSVRLINDSGFIRRYSVPAGEDYEIVCSGNPPLGIRPNVRIQFINFDDDIQTTRLNMTTIKSIKLNKKESDIKLFQYVCYHAVLGFPIIMDDVGNGLSICEVITNHDYPPVLNEFWCIEMDSQINCTWQVLGTDATSTLLYKDKYGNSMLLDAYKITSSDNYYGTWRCEWSLENVKQHGLEYHNDISLVLQACRLSYCANQTYHIDRTSIMKTTSPVGLGVMETEPNRAVITWDYNEGYPVEYNITYRLPGLEWAQELKASSQENCDGRNCKLEIKLLCPGVLYELKMYVKSTSAPKETAYWSDPATITFHAGSQDSTDAVDPMCNEEPESIVNKYVGAQKAKEFRRNFNMIYMKALSGKIQSMKRKLDLINKLCREQSLGDCESVLSTVKMP